ncbi:hypothetical protein CSAL01_03000 [Colletotrichum salicis]|uniref:Uncharacterized protein n=1 Tax=Colletotrichum salicis TaxID=1209931 RepID=A0A135SUY0_9PEZI|nr:hypothetical protein CSAL01_03000 [Colletotrichum salicis]
MGFEEASRSLRQLHKANPYGFKRHVNPGGKSYIEVSMPELKLRPSPDIRQWEILRYPWRMGKDQIQWKLQRLFMQEFEMRKGTEGAGFLVQCAKWIGDGPHLDLLETLLHLGYNVSEVVGDFQDWPQLSSPNWISEEHTPDPFFIEYFGIVCKHNQGFAGVAPLHRAILLESTDIVVKWISKSRKDEKNSLGQTPLHLAVGDPQRMGALIEAGHNVNSTDIYGITPLMYAAVENQAESTILLIEVGASINAVDTTYGRGFLYYAAAHFGVLLENGFELFNHMNSHGQTPLTVAAKLCEPDLVKKLVEVGADVNLKDSYHRTALHLAREKLQKMASGLQWRLGTQGGKDLLLSFLRWEKHEELGMSHLCFQRYSPDSLCGFIDSSRSVRLKDEDIDAILDEESEFLDILECEMEVSNAKVYEQLLNDWFYRMKSRLNKLVEEENKSTKKRAKVSDKDKRGYYQVDYKRDCFYHHIVVNEAWGSLKRKIRSSLAAYIVWIEHEYHNGATARLAGPFHKDWYSTRISMIHKFVDTFGISTTEIVEDLKHKSISIAEERGDQCVFPHISQFLPSPESALKGLEPTGPAAEDSRSKIACVFLSKGHCRNGVNCPFSHTGVVTEAGLTANEVMPLKPEEKCMRELLGAWVNFGSGASVEKVSLFSDFSTASILALPARSDVAAVSRLLSRLGFDVPSTTIRMRPQGLGGLICVIIRVEDPDFAQSLCERLKKPNIKDVSGFPGLKAEVQRPLNLDPNKGFTHRVNRKKVICSWHKPKQLACLTFRSDSVESEVRSNFGTGEYTVLRKKVPCAPRSSTLLHRWGCTLGGSYSNGSSPELTLYIPPQATKTDILNMIPQRQRPTSVELEVLQDLDNTKSEVDMVEALLVGIGPLEMRLTANADPDGKRVKATARFQEEADATTAVGLLRSMPLPFNKADKLSITGLHSATYKVANHIFSAILVDFEKIAQSFRKKGVNFKRFPSANGYVTLRLESEMRDDLATAETHIDKLLEGSSVYDADGKKPLWSPSFNNKPLANRRLRPIEEQHKVAFQCVPSKAEIHVFGSFEASQKACDALLQSFSDNPSTIHYIPLTSESLHWAIRGGFKAICKVLGQEAVSLNILETPKRLEIIGPLASFGTAIDIVTKGRLPQEHDISTEAEECCPVCWTTAENPLKVKCEHVYCRDCFENFCKSTVSSGESGIRCLADEWVCNASLSLQELQDCLPSITFEELLASAGTNHIKRHPAEFR